MALMATNSLAEARSEIETALKLDSTETRLVTTAGQIYMSSGQPQLAEKYFKQATESNPNVIGPYIMLVQLYARTNRQQEAMQVLQRIGQIDPATAQILYQQLMSGQLNGGPGFNPIGTR
jgi:predicted Zn-dependent protease